MVKNKQKKIVLLIILFISILLITGNVFAISKLTPVEYSKEYKEWLELPEEERQKRTEPRMYDVPKTEYTTKNPLKIARMLGSSNVSKYSLKDIIPANIVIKNQKTTNECWAFSNIAMLETNLALKDHYSQRPIKVYDFSERHMDYTSSRTFLNGVINKNSLNREVGSGGNTSLAMAYLTNGNGAINENEMPFEDNENKIDISAIQNKKVVTQIYDTIDFPSYSITEDTTAIKQQMKEHIKNYGGITASIHGAQLMSDYYNNSTGAIYCDNQYKCPQNHAVLVIGWDDNFDKNNFNEAHRPKSNGAWIIKNSWGDKIEENLSEFLVEYKKLIFSTYTQECINNGWTDATQIPDDFAKNVIIQNGYTIEGDKVTYKVGDNGIMYISYEDVNIYKTLTGIINAENSTNYENIYQYDYCGHNGQYDTYTSTVYIANVFNKKTQGKEFIKQVLIYAPETYTCKVYVNPNGTSKAKSDLQEVKLKAGDSETFGAGYHTIEFAKPVEIKSTSFVVAIEINGNSVKIPLEGRAENTIYSTVEIENEKCFYATRTEMESNQWSDLSQINCDNAFKVFTTSVDDSLANIKVTQAPSKTTYVEGQNFDKTGMIVTANYNNGKSNTITDYNITNGTNLKIGQTSVTITYEDVSTTQAITVSKNVVTSLRIKTAPTKTKYLAGDDFEKAGMVVEAVYTDGTAKTVTDYTITNGVDLKNGQTTITVSYGGKTITQAITVEPNPVQKIEIQKAPNKTSYVEGQNFDKTGMQVIATYKSGKTKQITDYTITDGKELKLTQTTVTISYENLTVTQKITVEKKDITSIKVKTVPTKTTYIQGKEELDLTGGVIQIIYNDGTTEDLSMNSEQVTVSGFNNNEIGTKPITVTYKTKTVSFSVTIKEEQKEEEIKNSNFENAKGTAKSIKAYYYTDKNKKEYIVMNVETTGIKRETGSEAYEYYYYLSSNQDEKGIDNWVKISEAQNQADKLEFAINTKNISNYEEVSNADTLYLYIKEVAIKGEQQKIAISKSILLEANSPIEEYIDDVKKQGNNITNNGNNNNANKGENKDDNTQAQGKIPQTGETFIIISVIVIITVIGVFVYIRYKNIDR